MDQFVPVVSGVAAAMALVGAAQVIRSVWPDWIAKSWWSLTDWVPHPRVMLMVAAVAVLGGPAIVVTTWLLFSKSEDSQLRAAVTVSSEEAPARTLAGSRDDSESSADLQPAAAGAAAEVAAMAAPTATATPAATPIATPTPEPPGEREYVVASGDSLYSIAEQSLPPDTDGATILEFAEAIAAYNNTTDPSTIFIGQVVKVPPR